MAFFVIDAQIRLVGIVQNKAHRRIYIGVLYVTGIAGNNVVALFGIKTAGNFAVNLCHRELRLVAVGKTAVRSDYAVKGVVGERKTADFAHILRYKFCF